MKLKNWDKGEVRRAIFWSVTVYNKNVSSQCNLPAQIEQVQDTNESILNFEVI